MQIRNGNDIIEFTDIKGNLNSDISHLYIDGNKVIKVYNEDINDFNRLDKDIFDKLSKLDSKAFLKLRDYYGVNVKRIIDDKEIPMTTAYSYDYVNRKDKFMIDMPMDYTINTLYEFDKIVKYLNDEKILIGDSHAGNVVISDNNLVIIDPDYYEFSNFAKRRNRELINFYITDLWCLEAGLSNYFDRKAVTDILYKGYMQDYLKENIKRLDEKTPRDLIEKTLRKRNK